VNLGLEVRMAGLGAVKEKGFELNALTMGKRQFIAKKRNNQCGPKGKKFNNSSVNLDLVLIFRMYPQFMINRTKNQNALAHQPLHRVKRVN